MAQPADLILETVYRGVALSMVTFSYPCGSQLLLHYFYLLLFLPEGAANEILNEATPEVASGLEVLLLIGIASVIDLVKALDEE